MATPPKKRLPKSKKFRTAPPSPNERASHPALGTTIGILFLVIGVVASYANSLDHDFVFDDLACITKNPSIGSYDPIDSLSRDDVPVGLKRRPVASWSFTANYRAFGLDPAGYRMTNIFIHILATLVLFDLARRILIVKGFPTAGNQDAAWIAFGIAGLWAFHPIQTESVTYIVQRIEALMGLFFLLTLYCFFLGSQSNNGSAIWYLLSVLFLSLGMATKEVMIVAPIAVLLLDYVFLHHGGETGRTPLWSRWWVYLAFLPATLWLISMTLNTDYSVQSKKAELGAHPERWEYFLTQPGVICEYLRISLFPIGLCFDRYWPLADTLPQIAIPGAFLLILLGFSIVLLVQRRAIGWIGFCFFLILAPTSSIMPIGTIYFEHRMYLPLACVTTLFALGLYWLIRRRLQIKHPAGLAVPLVVLAALLCWKTALRNRDYRDYETLTRATLDVDPESHRCLVNLAAMEVKRGNFEPAIAYYQRAIEVAPREGGYWMGLANAYSLSGSPKRALDLLDEVDRRIVVDEAEWNHQLALAHDRLGNWGEAERYYRDAIERNSDDPRIYVDYGVGLAEQNNLAEAQRMLTLALEIDPDNVQANLNLGTVIMLSGGSVNDAIRFFETAVRAEPQNALARDSLRRALLLQQQLSPTNR